MLLRKNRHGIPVEQLPDQISQEEDPDPLKDESLIRDLENALQHLTREQKTCIRMFYLEKKSYQAISADTGFNLMQVKSYLQNGRRNLRLLLEKKLDKFDE